MKEEQKRLFETLHSFRKLNISGILPNISHGDYGVLKMIDLCNRNCEKEQGGVKVSSIARCMQLPVSAVSRSLRTLEEKGCILRSVNRDDRRNIYVEVTDTGRELLKEVEEILSDFADAVFGQLGEDTIEQLNQYLCRLFQTAKEELERRKYTSKSEQEGGDQRK